MTIQQVVKSIKDKLVQRRNDAKKADLSQSVTFSDLAEILLQVEKELEETK